MSEDNTITRFAPSPTGQIHIGNARSAILNWVYAKKNKGKFILRIDDTDKQRSKDEFIYSIKEDLKWLNIDWDLSFKQSERLTKYEEKIKELKSKNRLYACFETQEELSLKRKSLLSSGKPPIYDRRSLKLSDKEKEILISQGRKPHWRFLLENKIITWYDKIRGQIEFDSKNLSDPILIREDGSLLYHLPSVIDDISEKITDIIRGEDHITNTAFHIQIFESLNSKPPNFGHHSLLVDKSGKGLSKRLGSISIENIKNKGFESISILNYLLTVGTSQNIKNEIELLNLIQSFELNNLAKSTAKFDKDDLVIINSDLLKKMSFESVEEKLKNLGISNINIQFWNFIKNNLSFMKDSVEWWKIISSNEVFIQKKDEFMELCASVLPNEPFNEDTWDEWINSIKVKTDKKGKSLFMPIRFALTGKDTGPELKYMLPLLSRQIILKRLGS